MFEDDIVKIEVDLTDKIKYPGQYSVKLVPEQGEIKIEIVHAEIHYEGRKALDEFVNISANSININRTAQVTEESSSVLYLNIKCSEPSNGKVDFRPAFIY